MKDHNIKFYKDFTSGNRTDSSSMPDGWTDGKYETNRCFSRL